MAENYENSLSQVPRAQDDIFVSSLLCLTNSPKLKKKSIYDHINHRKEADPHIWETETAKLLKAKFLGAFFFFRSTYQHYLLV